MAKYFKKIYLNSFIINNIESICSSLSEDILYEAVEFDNGYEADLHFDFIQLDKESIIQFYFKLYDETNCFIDDGNAIYHSPLGKYYLEDDDDNTYVIEVMEKSITNINKVNIILSKNKIEIFNKHKIIKNSLTFENTYLEYKNNNHITIAEFSDGHKISCNVLTNINNIGHKFFPSSGNDKELYQKWYIIDSEIQEHDIHVIDIKKE